MGAVSEMSVKVYPLLAHGVFATYGYFVMDNETCHGFLIDPGAQPQLFLQAIRENSWTIEAILLTHGHFDHTGAVNDLRRELDIPALAHDLSDRYLLDARLNLSASHGRNVAVPDTVKFSDGEHLELSSGCIALEVLHVPGHTDDSCAFYCMQGGFALVGDTVYEGGPGLTVFPTGNTRKLYTSIREKILALPESTMLLSGHSRPLTAARLKASM